MKELIKHMNPLKIKSFDPLDCNTGYKLKDDLMYNQVAKIGLQALLSFEESDNIVIAFRGVKKDMYFRDYMLSKFFIVGEKSKYYLDENKNDLYTGDFNDKEKLISNINEMIIEINKIILEREIPHKINGQLEFIDTAKETDELRLDKLAYLSVLHNIGGRWENKGSSPYMSTTYGENKFANSLKFCKCASDTDIAFIFIYFIPKKSPYYIKTIEINNLLKKLGVNWYEDINSEIMALDGILPHYLFGILEITDSSTKCGELIINPWLINQYENKLEFNPLEGINIDQSNFNQYAIDLGYKKYYSEYQDDSRQQFNMTNEPLDMCVKITNE